MRTFFRRLLDEQPWLWVGFAIILLLPALMVNLGIMPLSEDEATRAIVAMEMMFSGNYVVPTFAGEYYYNKPPLFNWIVGAFFAVAGNYSEFSLRMVPVASLLGFGLTIFLFFRKRYGNYLAALFALVFITSGRLLFWESFLGLIDITYSWVTYASFLVIYTCFEKKQWWKLFLLSYLLAVVGFLMKALPSVVFQGLTLLAWFVYKKEFRKLFLPAHFAGGALFLALLAGYYWLYLQYNPGSFEVIAKILFGESSQRTVLENSVQRSLQHMLEYPGELMYHFLPWTAAGILLLIPDIRREVFKDEFVQFNALIFLVNIFVYWISPEVSPRYILMLAPLLLMPLTFAWLRNMGEDHWIRKAFDVLLIVALGGATLASLAYLFVPITAELPFVWPVSIGSFIAIGLFTYLFIIAPNSRPILLVLVLLVLRVQFNFLVLPTRIDGYKFTPAARGSEAAADQIPVDQPLYIYSRLPMVYVFNGPKYVTRQQVYYLSRVREEIIPIRDNITDYSAFYLARDTALAERPHEVLHEIPIVKKSETLKVVRFSNLDRVSKPSNLDRVQNPVEVLPD
ncbi:MAG: hypothetical protein AAGI38_16280 [Bacteroidota bacterium]